MRHPTVALLLGFLFAAPADTQRLPDHGAFVNTSAGDQIIATHLSLTGTDRTAIDARIQERHQAAYHTPAPPATVRAVWYLLLYHAYEPDGQGKAYPSVEGATANWFSAPPRSTGGPVRIDGHAFADAGGPFKGFGASYFSALHRERVDRAGLIANLAWLSGRDVNYIRVLSMVGAQPYWQGRVIDPQWPGYFGTFADLLVDARNAGPPDHNGLRVQVVLFADAQVMMPAQSDRIAWVDTMAAFLETHRDTVQFVEIANESQLNGISDADLAVLTRRWEVVSQIPVAPSSPDGSGNPEAALGQLFRQQFLTADLLTPHFQRDSREEGYRHWRQPWEVQFYDEPTTTAYVSNEPMGPGRGDTNPSRLAIGMATTFVARGAGWTLHTDAGVQGHHDFWAEPGIEPVMQALRFVMVLLPDNIGNGTLCGHAWSCHPYEDLDQIWPDHGGTGVVRAYASEVGGRTYVAVMGMRDHYDVRAKWPMTVEVFDLCARQRAEIVTLSAGQGHTFRVTPCRDFIHRITRR